MPFGIPEPFQLVSFLDGRNDSLSLRPGKCSASESWPRPVRAHLTSDPVIVDLEQAVPTNYVPSEITVTVLAKD